MNAALRACIRRGLFVGLALLASHLYASKERPTIGLCLDTLKDERWQRDRDSFVAAVGRLGGVALVESAELDDALQAQQVRDMAKKGVDVMVIVPHNADAMGNTLNKLATDIPVISYDRLILNAPIACYVSFDNVKVGEMQATYLVSHLPAGRTARIVRIYGAPTDNNAKLFKQGQDNVLGPLIASGKIQVVGEGWAEDWRAESAKAIVSGLIRQYGLKIDGVLASNDNTAGGAVDAITDAGGDPTQMVITGQDGDLAACVRIKTGTQSMTVYKQVNKLAELAARVALELARGGKPAATATIQAGSVTVPAIFEDAIAVDKSNLATTVLAERFHHSQ